MTTPLFNQPNWNVIDGTPIPEIVRRAVEMGTLRFPAVKMVIDYRDSKKPENLTPDQAEKRKLQKAEYQRDFRAKARGGLPPRPYGRPKSNISSNSNR